MAACEASTPPKIRATAIRVLRMGILTPPALDWGRGKKETQDHFSETIPLAVRKEMGNVPGSNNRSGAALAGKEYDAQAHTLQ